ncbi:enoyl-CoA hydratase-related protein [Schinkia azotoformans]|uniref:Enoyl-CoA hydratase n=1 Tax=Schinkia azotoformans LMG 9581 TaxID=1131731 RepID=K6DRY8_SCHAZ|nr:enoyl-CoA hydratase-related protein [Schinkia azotoformans]EKN63526.1 enoyl-CoA hydratase [Schinkia azotoformans LMG 9581]MEC1638826.1 enoyl-CoA hydratase-related protein [Schinkia azotoformans]MEC1946791.1 enoyl-CoA hydratase-related protein [Schinkia azotoformans]MED4353196.1 enoyl-CoA hydratase-related protein [Schinkia azotoformans]
MSNFQYINVLSRNSIGYINLNRPKVLNALSRSMVREIVNAMEDFDQNDEIKVIIMSGEGRAFAAGADIDEMAEDDPVRFELLNQFKDWDRIALIKKPIIGAVHGFTLGGGFELALCCDILFAAENAQFGFPEIKLGVMPGAGGTQRLTKLMGKTKALEWLWLGEPMSAKEALHYGVVNRLVAPEILLEETVRFAEKIAMQPPLSLRLIKEAVQKAVDYSLYEGMQFERKNFYLLFSSQDQKEGMKAFIEKRKPNFEGK